MIKYVILYNGLPELGTAEEVLGKIAGYGGLSVNVWMTRVTAILRMAELDTTNYDNFLQDLADLGLVEIKEMTSEPNQLPDGAVADKTD